jgi:hypothetical protein
VSATARRIARYWAEGADRSTAATRGIARQVQDHLDHGGDPEHLHRLAGWMSITHPTLCDLDMALDFPTSPQPAVLAYAGHHCRCRSGSAARRRGAPAPKTIRQLIRRSQPRAA